jgi:hypothetical protein
VFGAHAHRLTADLEVLVTARLPRDRPYNSFVSLPDGSLATKDFGGVLPGQHPTNHDGQPTELPVLDPDGLGVLARVTLAEPSIARLSADGDTLYVVGTSRLFSARWNGHTLVEDADFQPR